MKVWCCGWGCGARVGWMSRREPGESVQMAGVGINVMCDGLV